MVNNFNIADFLNKFDDNYDFIYDANSKNKEVAGQLEAAAAFDDFLKQHGDFVREFVNYRGDVISSDREAAAFMFTVDDFCQIGKTNGKNAAIYLFGNDKNCQAEWVYLCTLYWRPLYLQKKRWKRNNRTGKKETYQSMYSTAVNKRK